MFDFGPHTDATAVATTTAFAVAGVDNVGSGSETIAVTVILVVTLLGFGICEGLLSIQMPSLFCLSRFIADHSQTRPVHGDYQTKGSKRKNTHTRQIDEQQGICSELQKPANKQTIKTNNSILAKLSFLRWRDPALTSSALSWNLRMGSSHLSMVLCLFLLLL